MGPRMQEVRKALGRIEKLLGKDPVLSELNARAVLGGLVLYVAASSRAMGLSVKGQHMLLQCANDDMDLAAKRAALPKDVVAALDAAAEKGDLAGFLKVALNALMPKQKPKPQPQPPAGEVSGTEYALQGRVDPAEVAKVDAEADRIIAAALDKKPEPDKEN